VVNCTVMIAIGMSDQNQIEVGISIQTGERFDQRTGEQRQSCIDQRDLAAVDNEILKYRKIGVRKHAR